MEIPRIVIAATGGSSAKTLVSVGLLSVWKAKGRDIIPFKKGPDYIDAAWLSRASQENCRNLDVYLMGESAVCESFIRNNRNHQGAVIEGNRGLFDGVDEAGTYSTAQLARLLKSPVIVVLNCHKMTTTAAAMVLGLCQFDPEVNIAGVILNRVSGKRHEKIIRDAIEATTDIPVVGCLPNLKSLEFPERYLGLLPPQERDTQAVCEVIQKSAQAISQYVDHEWLWKIARKAPVLEESYVEKASSRYQASVRIGFVRDEAFQFYYPDNLESLEEKGAKLIELNALKASELGEIDALYLGGGFPEQFVEPLSQNKRFLKSVRQAAEEGLPIYAECGGAMFLGRGIWMGEKFYPMADVFPVEYVLQHKPVGHGYTTLVTRASNPFYPEGVELKGHEFHYSKVKNINDKSISWAFEVKRGYGFDGGVDGMMTQNVLATYTHLHSLCESGGKLWVDGLLERAREYGT